MQAGLTLLLVPAEVEPLSVYSVRATVVTLLALLLHCDWDAGVIGPRRFLICLPGLLFLQIGVFWIFALLFVFLPFVDEIYYLSREQGTVIPKPGPTRHVHHYCRTPAHAAAASAGVVEAEI